MGKIHTPEELKALFAKSGMTFTQWAKENGYTPNKVYRVINGQSKAKYGTDHEIAVKLCLKNAPENFPSNKEVA